MRFAKINGLAKKISRNIVGLVETNNPLSGSDLNLLSEKQKVMGALENSKYTWRTVRGVAAEAGVPEDRVRQIFNEAIYDVVFSNYYSPSGERLFASRKHLLAQMGPLDQISGSFRNRIY